MKQPPHLETEKRNTVNFSIRAGDAEARPLGHSYWIETFVISTFHGPFTE